MFGQGLLRILAGYRVSLTMLEPFLCGGLAGVQAQHQQGHSAKEQVEAEEESENPRGVRGPPGIHHHAENERGNPVNEGSNSIPDVSEA